MLKIGISLLSRHRPGVEMPTITSTRVDPEAPPAIFRRLRRTGLPASRPKAPVAELVDALDSKSSSARSAGSIPARGTIQCQRSPVTRGIPATTSGRFFSSQATASEPSTIHSNVSQVGSSRDSSCRRFAAYSTRSCTRSYPRRCSTDSAIAVLAHPRWAKSIMRGASASLNHGVTSNSIHRILSAVWQVAWIIESLSVVRAHQPLTRPPSKLAVTISLASVRPLAAISSTERRMRVASG